MFDIVLSTRDNIEWIPVYLNSYKRCTKNIKDHRIIIVDSSTEENRQKLSSIIHDMFFDLDISLEYFSRTKHYHDIWIEGIKLTRKEYVLFTHADIVYLKKDWDIFLKQKIEEGNTLISVSVRSKNHPESVWICCSKNIFIQSKFSEAIIDNKIIEHGNIEIKNNNLNSKSFYINEVKLINHKYGEIAMLDNVEFIYHNYYSSRIKQDSLCPIPNGPEIAYLEKREPFDETIIKLEKYNQLDSDIVTLYEYLTNI